MVAPTLLSLGKAMCTAPLQQAEERMALSWEPWIDLASGSAGGPCSMPMSPVAAIVCLSHLTRTSPPHGRAKSTFFCCFRLLRSSFLRFCSFGASKTVLVFSPLSPLFFFFLLSHSPSLGLGTCTLWEHSLAVHGPLTLQTKHTLRFSHSSHTPPSFRSLPQQPRTHIAVSQPSPSSPSATVVKSSFLQPWRFSSGWAWYVLVAFTTPTLTDLS